MRAVDQRDDERDDERDAVVARVRIETRIQPRTLRGKRSRRAEQTAEYEPFYSNATWAFVSSGSNERDAVIYLPRIRTVPPVDSLPCRPDDPSIGHPSDPPMDSL